MKDREGEWLASAAKHGELPKACVLSQGLVRTPTPDGGGLGKE